LPLEFLHSKELEDLVWKPTRPRPRLSVRFRRALVYGIFATSLGILLFARQNRTSALVNSASMRWSLSTALLSLAGIAASAPEPQWGPPFRGGSEIPKHPLGPDADGKYTISSEGIRAQFIPYGASVTNLFIKDIRGVERDVVLGFDNATHYGVDKSHPHLGGVPGRYANRIKNATFTINGQTYKVDANENGGLNTLHGGSNGWDYRQFEVIAQSESAITFAITDPDGTEGFPGTVRSYISYAVTPYQWHMRMNATRTKWTPVMLSSHVYWNLDGFQNPNTPTALNHSLWLPFSGMRVDVDGILIPTGVILPNPPGSVNDFWTKPKEIGTDLAKPELVGNCGTGCTGYDNCWLVNRDQYKWNQAATKSRHSDKWWRGSPVASLSSDWSGIQIDVYSEQEAFQVYSCNGQDGTLPLKKTQGFFNDTSRPRVTQKYGCVVMEVEDWIDGINQPAWQRGNRQITGPGLPAYTLEATHVFSVKKPGEQGKGYGRRPGPMEGIEDPEYL